LLDHVLGGELAELRGRDLERHPRTLSGRRGAVVSSDGVAAVDFSSNDYLGLASDALLAAAATRALREHGTGAAASRLIAGTTIEHVALEQEIARFMRTERALSFSSGYATNVGVIPALVTRGDIIFADRLNHASLIDGCRSSRATVHVYDHGDGDALARALAEHRVAHRRALIVTDGIFSMDGDVAPLPVIVELARRFDAWTYVDDAHAAGVVGPEGRGTAALLGIDGEIDVTVGTLGKAFGASGAYVAGSAVLCTYLLNRARSFIFSTAPMPAQAAAAAEGIRVAAAEPDRRERVAAHARLMRETLRSRGVPVVGAESMHIVPVVIGDASGTMRIGERLSQAGFLVGSVRPPTVPDGTSRLRISLSAAHTGDQIRALAAAVAEAIAR
jgi:8-amino-7-oxononanoate synthase